MAGYLARVFWSPALQPHARYWAKLIRTRVKPSLCLLPGRRIKPNTATIMPNAITSADALENQPPLADGVDNQVFAQMKHGVSLVRVDLWCL